VAKTRSLAEPLVKELCGGDSISVRPLYKNDFTFKPTCKVWLAANHSPRISDDDSAIWRRLRRVPFERVPAKPDPAVKRHLTTDPGALAAALAWAVQGCLIWQDTLLGTCERVADSTADLRAEMDPLAEFFNTCCVLRREAQVDAQALRSEYEKWAKEMGARALGNVEWGRRLAARGCERRVVRRSGITVRVWGGIGLLEAQEEPTPF